MRCIIIAAALAVVLVAASAVPTGGLTKPFDMDRECTEGASWGPDACNTCHCTGGRGACTLMLCFSPDGKTDDSQNNRKCQPAGAAWKGRNADCVCNASGKTECTETPQGDEPQPGQERQRTCSPGSSWSDGCNHCFCSKTGIPACTLAFCLKPEQGDGPQSEQERQLTCSPGSAWSDGCNHCFCSKTGIAACTLAVCLKPEGDEPQPGQERQLTCSPGSAWSDGCNHCFCSKTGIPACTLALCLKPEADQPQGDEPQPAQEQQPTCKSGSSWSDGCNNCTCTEAGIPACTLKLCLKTEKCTPGAVWRRDCNTCRCGPDGEPACTKMMCVPQKPPNQETAMGRCTPGVQWKEECNTCWCSEAGERACTEIDCSGRPVYSILVQRFRRQASCQPGTHWKKDCNTCHCSDNGVPFCTYRLCLTPGQVQDMSGLVERTRREGSERMEGEQ